MVDVSASRNGRNRRYARRPSRFLTVAQVQAGRGGGVGHGALDIETLTAGLESGYAAKGPWEVERKGDHMKLMHYAFPILTAKFEPSTGWRITKVEGRPGFGMSATDKQAAWFVTSNLIGYEASRKVTIPKQGKNADSRLAGVRGMGSRVSPYAVVDEERTAALENYFGRPVHRALYTAGTPYPARRGRKA